MTRKEKKELNKLKRSLHKKTLEKMFGEIIKETINIKPFLYDYDIVKSEVFDGMFDEIVETLCKGKLSEEANTIRSICREIRKEQHESK